MINEELNNKMQALFPTLTNADANGNTLGSASDLWKGVAEQAADTIADIVAPVKGFILDVQPDLQMRNPDALPVMQVEVITTMGGALVDTDNWDVPATTNKYVDVKLHRISRPFKLTAYDLMRGERVETKVKAAMKEVAQGVVKQFYSVVEVASPATITEFGPEKCAEISGVFDGKETDTLLLSPKAYSAIVPTNGMSLNPAIQGVYGINHIYKSGLTISEACDVTALTKDAVAGAVATPEIVFNQQGQGMQYLGEIAGIPMVLISQWDYNKQCIKCSVETLAGFALTDAKNVKQYTISA